MGLSVVTGVSVWPPVDIVVLIDEVMVFVVCLVEDVDVGGVYVPAIESLH